MARPEVTGRRPLEEGSPSALAAYPGGPPAMFAAYSIAAFCKAHSISPDMFFKLMRQGLGPKVFRVGRRTLISVPAAEEWVREREAAAARDVAA
jgi:hypothetical protein